MQLFQRQMSPSIPCSFLCLSFMTSRVPNTSKFHSTEKKSSQEFPFWVEKKDGTMSKLAINLTNVTPHQILQRMAESIEFPMPPTLTESRFSENLFLSRNSSSHWNSAIKNDVDKFIWMTGWGARREYKLPNSMNRDVLHFLKDIDFDQIKQRKLSRINATACALVARRAFKFLAIDGTKLGWSSSSLAICLSRLTSLHEDHQSRLQIKSFYPFRLLLSSDEFRLKVDAFAGTIRLNPASTSLQWLDTLASVTEDNVRMVKKYQDNLTRNIAEVENALGLRVVKGHTCDPEEFHHCIEQLGLESSRNRQLGDGKALLFVPKQIVVVLESSEDCRHGKLRKDGSIAIGAGTSLNEIRATVASLASRANEYVQVDSENQTRFLASADQFMYEFGVQKISKASSMVTSEQMSECLSVLLSKDEAEKYMLRGYLAGQSIGVAGDGHLCHLGDDGSIIIPANCS